MIPRFLCVVSVLKWSILICFCITISVTWNIVRIKVYLRLFVHLSSAKIISKFDWKWKMILTPTWFEHAAFWSGVRRATVAPRSRTESGSTEIWTRIAGFKVQSANHYTMEPRVSQQQVCFHQYSKWDTLTGGGKKLCFLPGSNRRPCACEAHVITATLRKPAVSMEEQKWNHPIWGSNPGPLD